eukprot:56032-Eustigmatos_ZCMA.PRE.1
MAAYVYPCLHQHLCLSVSMSTPTHQAQRSASSHEHRVEVGDGGSRRDVTRHRCNVADLHHR